MDRIEQWIPGTVLHAADEEVVPVDYRKRSIRGESKIA